jgi:hypothetical protein
MPSLKAEMVNFNVETMTNINVQTLKEEDGRL